MTATSLGLVLHSLKTVVFYNARGLHLVRQLDVIVLLEVVDLPVKSLSLVRSVELELYIHQRLVVAHQVVSCLHNANGAIGYLRVGPRARRRERVLNVLVLLRVNTIGHHATGVRDVVKFQIQVNYLGLSEFPVLSGRGRYLNLLKPPRHDVIHDVAILAVGLLLGVLVRTVADDIIVVAIGLLPLVEGLVRLLGLAGILLLKVGTLVVHKALRVLLVHHCYLPTYLLLGSFRNGVVLELFLTKFLYLTLHVTLLDGVHSAIH